MKKFLFTLMFAMVAIAASMWSSANPVSNLSLAT